MPYSEDASSAISNPIFLTSNCWDAVTCISCTSVNEHAQAADVNSSSTLLAVYPDSKYLPPNTFELQNSSLQSEAFHPHMLNRNTPD